MMPSQQEDISFEMAKPHDNRYAWRLNCEDGSCYGICPENYETRAEYNDALRNTKAFPSDKEEASRKIGSQIVAELFYRRSVIAHQNDRSHASAVQNDISKEFVSDYISKIEAIVNAIHEIAERKG